MRGLKKITLRGIGSWGGLRVCLFGFFFINLSSDFYFYILRRPHTDFLSYIRACNSFSIILQCTDMNAYPIWICTDTVLKSLYDTSPYNNKS